MPLTVAQEQDSKKPCSVLALVVISHPFKHMDLATIMNQARSQTKVSSINGLSLQETQILAEETAIYPISYSTI